MSKRQAPGELEHVRVFVNTLDPDTGADEIGSGELLAAWLLERRLLDEVVRPTKADVSRALSLREALRALLFAHSGGPGDPAAAAALDAAALRVQLSVRFDRDALAVVVPGRGGVDAALGRLLAIVARSMADGTWARLKACQDTTCRWAFYDWTKNRSGVWCTMDVCGNRMKARTYRARRALST
jgi:predicted RNA-binding Zn ribbon-like protein